MKNGYLLSLFFGVFLSAISSAAVIERLEDPATGTIYIIESVETANAVPNYQRKQYTVYTGTDLQSLVPAEAVEGISLLDGGTKSYVLMDGREIWIRANMRGNQGAFLVSGPNQTELARYVSPFERGINSSERVSVAEKFRTVEDNNIEEIFLRTQSWNMQLDNILKVYVSEDMMSSLIVDKRGERYWVTGNKAIHIGELTENGTFFDPTGLQIKLRIHGRTAILESSETSELLILKQITNESFINALRENPPQMANYKKLMILDGHYSGTSGGLLTVDRLPSDNFSKYNEVEVRFTFNNDIYQMYEAPIGSEAVYLGKEKQIKLKGGNHSGVYLKSVFGAKPNPELLMTRPMQSQNFPGLVGVLAESFKLRKKINFIDLPPPAGVTSPGTELIKLHQECNNALKADKESEDN